MNCMVAASCSLPWIKAVKQIHYCCWCTGNSIFGLKQIATNPQTETANFWPLVSLQVAIIFTIYRLHLLDLLL